MAPSGHWRLAEPVLAWGHLATGYVTNGRTRVLEADLTGLAVLFRARLPLPMPNLKAFRTRVQVDPGLWDVGLCLGGRVSGLMLVCSRLHSLIHR